MIWNTTVTGNNGMWAAVAAITRWLDESNVSVPGDDAMRIMKLGEDIGETRQAVEGYFAALGMGYGRVTEAYIGMVGQNPRKGVTHNMDDVLAELADVVVTALSAIQHFTQDPAETRDVVMGKLDATMRRALIEVETTE